MEVFHLQGLWQSFVNTSALQQSVISDNYTNPIVSLNKEWDVLLWLASLIKLYTQSTTCVLTVRWSDVVPQTIQYLYNVSCQRPERKKKIPNVWNTTDKKVVPCCKTPRNFHNYHYRVITQQQGIFQILGNNQLDALFHVFIYFMSLHVSSVTVLIIRRSNCINTTSGMISLCMVLVCRSGPAYQAVTYTD